MGLDPTFSDAVVVVMTIMSLVIIFINGGCIYIINTSKVLREKTASILVYSILLLHLLQGCFVIPFYAAKKAGVTDATSKTIICDGFRFSYMITFYGACVNVLLISGDRFLAVKLMTSYKSVVTKRRMKIVATGMWLYILVLCLIPFIPTEAHKSSYCRYIQPNWWTITMLFTNTTIPYVVAIVSYVYIFEKLNKLARKQRVYNGLANTDDDYNSGKDGSTSTNDVFESPSKSKKNSRRDEKRNKALYQVTRLTFFIIMAYGITWAPSIIYYILLKVAPSLFTKEYNTSPAESYVTFSIKFITFFDAIFTPIIYCYFHNDFKREFRKYWQKIRTGGKGVIDQSIVISNTNNSAEVQHNN